MKSEIILMIFFTNKVDKLREEMLFGRTSLPHL